MITGLETLRDLPQMLTSANQVREEFRRSFDFPIVLWVSNEGSSVPAIGQSDLEVLSEFKKLIFKYGLMLT